MEAELKVIAAVALCLVGVFWTVYMMMHDGDIDDWYERDDRDY